MPRRKPHMIGANEARTGEGSDDQNLLMARSRSWSKTGFVRVLIQTGKKRDSRLPEAPTIWELMNEHKTPDPGKRLATIILAVGAFGRPYVSSPGLPPDRAKILQGAFKKTLIDPDFQAQAKERKLDIDPIAGNELETLAREVMAQPADVVERMKRLLDK